MTAGLATSQYICPGERHPIPPHVHAARIAIGYSACRTCPFAVEAPSATTGRDRKPLASENVLPEGQPTRKQIGEPVPLSLGRGARGEGRSYAPAVSVRNPTRSPHPQSLLTSEGIRGVYQNELDALAAERFATALATMLWEQVQGEPSRLPPRGFPVVVGYDERPWSIPIAAAVGSALRRSGCETIDIGLTTGALFRFATAHLDAAAGVFVTGAGCGPAFTGLDFTLAGGKPVSAGATLDRVAKSATLQNNRLTRRGGGHRVFDAAAPYEASLWRHFPDRTSTAIVVGSPSALVRNRLEAVRKRTGLNLRIISASQPIENRTESPIASVARESKSGFGFWIAEDGISCRICDETGAPVPNAALMAFLLSQAMESRPTGTVVVDWTLGDQLASSVLRKREAVRSRGTAEAMFDAMRDHSAIAGADSAGRFWMPGPTPFSDAIITLARLIHACSNADSPLSQRIKKAAS